MATLSSFYSEIKKGKYRHVYLIAGKAELLISEATEFLTDQFQKKVESSLNIRQLDAEETRAEEIVEEACTPPFFSEKRLLIVKNADKWSAAEQKTLVPLLKHPPEFTVLVLIGESTGKLQVISNILKKSGAVVVADLPKERDLIEWIRHRARMKGKSISGPAAAHLLEFVGKELRELTNAIDKLVNYVDKRKNIEVEDVSGALDDVRTRSIFELTDSVGNRRLAVALKSLRRLLETGNSPLMVISMLSRQFKLMWQAKEALRQGKTVSELANDLGTGQWIAKKMAKQAGNFSTGEIRRNLDILYQADKTLKTTMVPPELCLELLLLKICMGADKDSTFSPEKYHPASPAFSTIGIERRQNS